jgi:uncharacterized protein YcaQ
MNLRDLRRFAATHTLFPPTTLKRAMGTMGFVQADPIRAPARAQDLILRQRVTGYRAGDLDRAYATLGVEEDFFINYGFVTRSLQALMHPRTERSVPAGDAKRPSPIAYRKRVELLLAFVRQQGTVHPREVDRHFSHGKVRNYWGGTSNATTHMLDAMHYRGLLGVVGREKGIRLYGPREHSGGPRDLPERRARIDALADAIAWIYAPMPAKTVPFFLRRLRFAVPQWRGEMTAAITRAKARLARERIDGTEWYWPEDVSPRGREPEEKVRLLAPFDPVVQDRDRFEILWGWMYRFEAYTPLSKRKLGYYALPLLWRDDVVGWANLSVNGGRLDAQLGYVKERAPADRAFKRELEAEIERMRAFLGLADGK